MMEGSIVTFFPSMTARIVALAVVMLPAPLLAGQFDDLRLPEPSRPNVLAQQRAGRPAVALDALEQAFAPGAPDTWPVDAQVQRAHLLAAAGRPSEAATAWTAVGAIEPGLAEFAGRATVESLMLADQPARAEERLNSLSTGSPARTHPDLMLRLAATYLSAGQSSQAAELYRRVLGAEGRRSDRADAAALGLAAALEARGDIDEALETLHDAQRRHRSSKNFIAARTEARRLASVHGRRTAQFSEDEYRTLAKRLSDASRFAESVELLRESLEVYPSTSRGDETAAAIVRALYSGRQTAEAMSRADAFIDRYPGSRRVAAIKLLQFRLDVREGRTDGVRTRGYELWRGRVRGATLSQRRSAALLLGAYLVGIGEVTSGLEVYRELYRASTTASQQRDILWRAGVAALRDGQLDRAAVNLRGLMRRRPDAQLRLVGNYWLGVVEARIGNAETAARTFRQLIERSPYSYYGVHAVDAYVELRGDVGVGEIRRLLAPSQKFPELTLPNTVRDDSRLRAARVLALAGLPTAAAQLARELSSAYRSNRAVGLLAARASAAAGEHHLALTLADRHFRRYLERPTSGMPSDLEALGYPKAYWSDVWPAADREHVDPLLLLAIMRQESRYEAPVRSVAGAVGLFQMMSYTAAELAPTLGMDTPDEEALKQPAISTSLGARLVGKLMTMFDGHVAPVAASYNAGEDRVTAWWQSARDLTEPMFVDSMPYSETRNYVRRVMANYFAYQRVYAVPSAGARPRGLH